MEGQDIDLIDINNRDEENFLSDLYCDVQQKKPSGCMARSLIIATLPHKDPKTTEFYRENGKYKLMILAPENTGLPFGEYSRLLMAYISSEVAKTNNRTVFFGNSFSACMRTFNCTKSGGVRGTVTSMRNQMRRLFNATILMQYSSSKKIKLDARFGVSAKAIYYWDDSTKHETSWESHVTITEELYKEIINHPIPIDLDAIQALRGSSMAMDIYMWLTYRMYSLKKSTVIPWGTLSLQFGSEYGRTRAFKENFLIQLKRVLQIYPVKISHHQEGICLLPSRTHITQL